MSCGCEGNRRMKDIAAMRNLAKAAARMEGCVFIVYERKDGTFGFCKENEEYNGKLIEYVYG